MHSVCMQILYSILSSAYEHSLRKWCAAFHSLAIGHHNATINESYNVSTPKGHTHMFVRSQSYCYHA